MSWAGRAVAEALAELGPAVVVPEDLSWQAAGVSIDSRTLQAGELFVALSGPALRRGRFLAAGRRGGGRGRRCLCCSCLCRRFRLCFRTCCSPPRLLLRLPLRPLLPLCLRNDARRCRSLRCRTAWRAWPRSPATPAMRAARAVRRSPPPAARRPCASCSSAPSAADLPGALVHASEKSHNNLIGVSLTLARLPEEAAFAVLELGTNNPGEIADLAELARPELALLGAIGTAHIGRFASEDALAAEKAAILCGWEGGGPSLAVRGGERPCKAAGAGSSRCFQH